MNIDADVIITGAGPAGSLAAYYLAAKGISVLILEKETFPRYKVCGAGLTYKIIRELPFSVEPVIEATVYHFMFSTGFREVFERKGDYPLIFCTMRDRLDQFLLDQAVNAGAGIHFNENAREVIHEKDHILLRTKNREYRSKLVISAEGAAGAVARAAGLWKDIMPGLAWEAELKVDPASLEKYKSHVFLDWGAFPGGYGWMFPKKDHFSVGVGGPATLSRWMNQYYMMFLDYLASLNVQVEETMSNRSWPIPVRIKPGVLHTGRVMITGDAAGLTDPLTGEGIYYAVKSGLMAAAAAENYFSKGAGLENYTKKVNEELFPELLEANRIKYIFNTAPRKVHHFIRDNQRGWRAFGKILRGERNYMDVRNGFGKWRSLWSATSTAAKIISDRKEIRFRKEGF